VCSGHAVAHQYFIQRCPSRTDSESPRELLGWYPDDLYAGESMNVLSMGNPAGDHQPVEEEQRATVEGEKAASPRQTFPDSARVMPKRANMRY